MEIKLDFLGLIALYYFYVKAIVAQLYVIIVSYLMLCHYLDQITIYGM
jgi:hypothetical protein